MLYWLKERNWLTFLKIAIRKYGGVIPPEISITVKKLLKKVFMVPFYGWGSIASRLKSQYEKAVYFLPLSS